ncbi:copper amine oxidase N-terminal domain-containing protein [Paenibacillus ginsengarvi]|uniref:Copper amine oxidase N-terminal domain-containing protein n=1 Tax=Paenibacillus ginsengarvi TaxID=400777 RepID=A0A3B0CH36_9BACL|nr:copper amine oxidase N-terminal domain-containing protein [Paenibacillus ginsengarvi]RKN84450.1 copper amine oxidase N-terminal domain-containing protein [Paenibacillus ginsengarvi]
MKKKIAYLCGGLLLAVSGIAAADGLRGEYNGYPVVQVVVNGKAVQGEVPGINMDGSTLVPLRLVSEALGAKIDWNASTSTASVTIAALPAPSVPANPPETTPKSKEDIEKQRLEERVEAMYAKVETYIERLPVIREKIRIAKEFYDIKKSNQYFVAMHEPYWKTFEDMYLSIMTDTSSDDLNKAKLLGILDPEFIKLLDAAHNSFSYYKLSVEHFVRYVSLGQSQFLELYISSYANAFEEELKAKEMLEAAAQGKNR